MRHLFSGQLQKLSGKKTVRKHPTTPHNITKHPSTLHNATQHPTTPHNTPQHHKTPHNTPQPHTTLHNTTQHSTTPHNTTQHPTTPHNTPQHSTTTHNTTQHPTTPHSTHNTPQHHTTPHNTTQNPTTPHSNFQSDGDFIFLSQTAVYLLTAGLVSLLHLITLSDTLTHIYTLIHTHLVGFPWSRDRSAAQTSTRHHIIFVRDRRLYPGRIRTRNPSKRAAAVHSAPFSALSTVTMTVSVGPCCAVCWRPPPSLHSKHCQHNCIEQSPSWDANRSSPGQEILRILWNAKGHYRVHNSQFPVQIVTQINPVNSHFLKIYFNIILPSTPGSSNWSLSLGFPHQNSAYASPLPNTRYMPRPSHSSRFDHPNSTGWAVQIFKLLVM